MPPDCWARKTFPWDQPELWDSDTLALRRALIALRRSQPTLQTGDYTTCYADPDGYAFARTPAGSTILTALNVAESPRRLDIPLPAQPTAPSPAPKILFTTGGTPTAEVTPDSLTLTLPARGGTVLDAPGRSP